MKRLVTFVVIGALFTACNEEGSSRERKLDSLERRIDTTAEKVWDSTKAKAKDLKDRIEAEFEERDRGNKGDTL
jgi:hypothetical protein